MVLCGFSDKDGYCFPSIKLIAAKSGYGRSTVKKALTELENSGFIQKLGKKGRGYEFQIEILEPIKVVRVVKKSTRSKSDLGQNLTGGGSNIDQVPGQILRGNYIHDNNMKDNDNPSGQESGRESENQVKIVDPLEVAVNRVFDIQFFHTHFPSDFVGRKRVYAIPAVRELVKANLAVYSHEEILRLLTAYEPRMTEKFAPTPGKSVFVFFSDNKLSAIRKFVDQYDPSAPGQIRGYQKAYGKPVSKEEEDTVAAVKESIRKKNEGK